MEKRTLLRPRDVLSDESYIIYTRRNHGDSYDTISQQHLDGKITRQAVAQRVKTIQKTLRNELDMDWDPARGAERKRHARQDEDLLLDELQRLCGELGRRASSTDLTNAHSRYPSLYAYRKVFGTLRGAYEALEKRDAHVDLTPPKTHHVERRYSDEDLLECVRTVARYYHQQQGKGEDEPVVIPTAKQFSDYRKQLTDEERACFPAVPTFNQSFPGKWKGVIRALVAEGFKRRRGTHRGKARSFGEEDLFEGLRAYVRRQAQQYRRKAGLSEQEWPGEWPSWSEAADANKKRRNTQQTRDGQARGAEDLGSAPLTPSAYTMRNRMPSRSWEEVIARAKAYVRNKYAEEYRDHRRL